MIRLVSLIALAMMLFGCNHRTINTRRFESIWGQAVPASFKLLRVHEEHAKGAAFFGTMSEADFASFSNSTRRFDTWNPVMNGMVFEAGGVVLEATNVVRGVYSMGRDNAGAREVIIWDEGSETIVALIATGIM